MLLVDGTIFPIVAGFYYYPFVTGKQLSERLGTIMFWVMLVGFNVAFFPMHISGLLAFATIVIWLWTGTAADQSFGWD